MYNVYSVKKLREHLYMLTESLEDGSILVNMYLVEGDDKSLLFDSGFGIVDTLKNEVQKLTDRPVICTVGHGHPDHVGGAELFDKVYMNCRDEELLPVSLSYERRMGDVFKHPHTDQELLEYAKIHIVDPGGRNFVYENIDNGDILDLGGTRLQVYAIPGHTQGSIVLFNAVDNYALISDAVSARTALVNLPRQPRIGLEMYRDGLKMFKEAINEDTVLWYGHSIEPLDHNILLDMINACTQVLDGETGNDVQSCSPFAKRQSASGKKMTEHVTGSVTLVYDANLL